MKRSLACALSMLLLGTASGCAVTATQIYGRDGKPYQYVECRGLWRSLEDCYQKASQVCPAGYQIDDDVAPREAYDASLIIRCK